MMQALQIRILSEAAAPALVLHVVVLAAAAEALPALAAEMHWVPPQGTIAA